MLFQALNRFLTKYIQKVFFMLIFSFSELKWPNRNSYTYIYMILLFLLSVTLKLYIRYEYVRFERVIAIKAL